MEAVTPFLQQNLVTLLSYDAQNAVILAQTVEPKLFEGYYFEISKRVINYILEYKSPPKDHIADLFEDILNGDDEQKKKIYTKILTNIRDTYEGINTEYVMNSLLTWMRQQTLKDTIIECGKMYQDSLLANDPKELVASVEQRLAQGLKEQNNVFDVGTFLSDESAFKFLDNPTEAFLTGIETLDRYNIGPCRKELMLFIGVSGFGKTAFMIHCAKRSLLQGLKICHITLEMSEEKIAQRYYQSFFGVPKRYKGHGDGGLYPITDIELDELNRVTGLQTVNLKPKMALEDPKVKDFFKFKLDRWGVKFNNLVIKQFPDGTLTINQLKAYLDSLEAHHNFVPDILMVDYADKMKFSKENYRHEISQIYVDLRGMGVERNIAVITASQSNRLGKTAKIVSDVNVAESWDKVAIADTIVTGTATAEEKKLGLARLFVTKNRNDLDGLVILVSQNYAYGQFCLKSAQMVLAERHQAMVSELYQDVVGDI